MYTKSVEASVVVVCKIFRLLVLALFTTSCVTYSKESTEKTRVLFFFSQYPQLSETYMYEELMSLRDDYDVKVISFVKPDIERKECFPYEMISRKDSTGLKKAVQKFNPDVMHVHFLHHIPLVAQLADDLQIPFTVRTHSFDVLKHSVSKLRRQCTAANSRWCKRVLCFPGFKDRLVEHGLQKEKIVECWPVINYQRFYNPNKRVNTHKILNLGAAKKKKGFYSYVDFAATMKKSGLEFNLYSLGHDTPKIKEYNDKLKNPVANITQVEPKEMPLVYRDHDWLVYTADTQKNTVGLPLAIAEAQASGIGVCLQELPGRRDQLLEYLGGAGFLFKSIEEVADIITKPYPEEMRLRGYENAKKCDIEEHKILLTEVWDNI